MNTNETSRSEQLLRVLAYLRGRNRFLTSNFELAAILYLSRISDLAYEDMMPTRQGSLNSERLVDDLAGLLNAGSLRLPDLDDGTGAWTPSSAVQFEGGEAPTSLSDLLVLSPSELIVLAGAVFEAEKGRDAASWIRQSIPEKETQNKLEELVPSLLSRDRQSSNANTQAGRRMTVVGSLVPMPAV
jgi:hypothetical protein